MSGESRELWAPVQIVYNKNREISISWSFGGIPKGDPREVREFLRPQGGTERDRPLDIASQPSQAIRRKGFRRRPITKAAKHKLLKCAAMFEPQRKHRQVFLTGTLPGSTHEAQVEFARLFPRVVKLVQTYLPREMRQSASGLRYCWVAELQKRGAPHLHLALEVRSKKLARRALSIWRKVWGQVLRAVAESANCDIFERRRGGSWKDREDVWQSDAKLVRKRVDRYLSKYVSKGSAGMSCYYPPRWYGVSSALRKAEKEHLLRNTFVYDLKVPPGLSAGAVAEFISGEMKKFCVGRIGSRRPWNDVNRIWLYGYLREDISREESRDAVLVAMRIFDVSDREEARRRVVKPTFAEDVRVLKGVIARESPYWFRSELYSLLPERSRESFLSEDVPSRDAIVDVEFALKYLVSVNFPRGYGFAPWVAVAMKAVRRALEYE